MFYDAWDLNSQLYVLDTVTGLLLIESAPNARVGGITLVVTCWLNNSILRLR